MTEPDKTKTIKDHPSASAPQECSTEHTCACGEHHEPREGDSSHRDACVSPLKFGDTCCCGSGEAADEARTRCGHGPRCH